MELDLKGKSALITGGSKGIGFPGQPRDLGVGTLHEPLVPLLRFSRTVATGNAALRLEAES